MNQVLSKVIEFFKKDPFPKEYRSSVAGAAALLLTVSTLVTKLPPPAATPSLGSTAESASSPTASPSDVPTAGGTQTVTATTGPANVAAPKPRPSVKKGGVNVTIDASGVPVADLFTPAEDRIGISNSEVNLCGHAALSLGAAFNTSKDDLDVYWRWIKDKGGVYGRTVNMDWKDDAYTPSVAQQRAVECKDQNAFLLLGGIGFEQIPTVRKWAEDNHMLYLHHVASEDLTKKFSYSYLATEEKLGELFGEWVLSHHRNERIGIVHRAADDWNPGYNAFKRVVAGKVNIVVDDGTVKQQGVYSKEISDLISNDATTVFFWENALMATDIIKQSRGQAYHPHWLVFPFNTTTDTLEPDPLDKPFTGIAAWPSYAIGPHSGMYADEMKVFEDVYAHYRPGLELNDILWQTWMGMKQLHQLLLDCGKDCTRNKVAGLLLTGKHKGVTPGCPIDFTRNGHVGGFTANAFESYVNAYNKDDLGKDKLAWRETASCQEHF